MEIKNCKFYASIGGEVYAIDAWTENDKIYSTIYEDHEKTEGKSANCFCKFTATVGIYTNDCGIAEYGGSFENMHIPFEINKKWDYGNPWSNKVLVQTMYDFAWPFGDNDHAVVCKGGRILLLKTGYVRGATAFRNGGEADPVA